MTSFGKRLKKLRLEHKITQKELSIKLKISESAIGMYERDEREPSFEIVRKLACVFNVSTDYLIGDLDMSSINEINPEIDLQKALTALKEKKACWGPEKLSDSEQETLEKILEAVIKRERI
jgi:transcriptional regulator with XRE-family HTH domain